MMISHNSSHDPGHDLARQPNFGRNGPPVEVAEQADVDLSPEKKRRNHSWGDAAITITGINPNGREIRNADPIEQV